MHLLNDYEKARIVVLDKNNSFAALHEQCKLSISRLKFYRANPDGLKKANWEAVNRLANMYDSQNQKKGFLNEE